MGGEGLTHGSIEMVSLAAPNDFSASLLLHKNLLVEKRGWKRD